MTPYEKIIQFLREKGIEYEEFEHEPVYTSEQAAKVRGISAREGAKSLLLKVAGGFVLIILPGDMRMDSKKLKNLLGAKEVRFALPEEVKQVMSCAIGACYPFGNLIGIRTIADKTLLENENISFNPGVHNKTIKMKSNDYLSNVNPEMADVA